MTHSWSPLTSPLAVPLIMLLLLLQVWATLTQEAVGEILARLVASKKAVRMAQHAHSLLEHMLQVRATAMVI